MVWLQKNRTQLITIGVLIALFLLAIQSMSTEDWVVTTLRGLSTGAMIFLVAAGLSIIFGLMDVLNLAHGELFMVGAYVAWTMYVRPDTVIDGLTPFSIVAAGLIFIPVWRDSLLRRWTLPPAVTRVWPWAAVLLGGALIGYLVAHYPISTWSTENFQISPVNFSVALENGLEKISDPVPFEIPAPLTLAGLVTGSGLLSIGLAGLSARRNQSALSRSQRQQAIGLGVLLMIIAFMVHMINTPLTLFLFSMTTTVRFLIAVVVATVTGMILGAIIEMLLIRPLYDRPIYQIMMTLGIGFIGLELVRTVWGRSEFSMPRPALFAGSGDACPAANLRDLFANHCATYVLFDARVRVYNEFFLTLVGIVVLILVSLLLQRTRLGMIIRAGVEDSKMVEALGIDVHRVFTLVFALGAGLAALGGALASVALGLSNDMALRVLLLALIALAIGGLTSYPGAAAGALLVGLLQQFIVKYGQVGIHLPFIAEPFKPSPPLVPASTILLMVIILLLLPQGLFGQKES